MQMERRSFVFLGGPWDGEVKAVSQENYYGGSVLCPKYPPPPPSLLLKEGLFPHSLRSQYVEYRYRVIRVLVPPVESIPEGVKSFCRIAHVSDWVPCLVSAFVIKGMTDGQAEERLSICAWTFAAMQPWLEANRFSLAWLLEKEWQDVEEELMQVGVKHDTLCR